jgi:hypothetical protein
VIHTRPFLHVQNSTTILHQHFFPISTLRPWILLLTTLSPRSNKVSILGKKNLIQWEGETIIKSNTNPLSLVLNQPLQRFQYSIDWLKREEKLYLCWCRTIVVQLLAPFPVLSKIWTLIYILVWVTNNARSPTLAKSGLSLTMFTTLKPYNLNITAPSLGIRSNLGNGKSNLLMANISSLHWASLNWCLLSWSIMVQMFCLLVYTLHNQYHPHY